MHVRDLTDEERVGLDVERQWVADFLKGVGSDVRMTGTRSDIPTLHSLLDQGPYTDNAENELIIYGTLFGDILAKELGLHWVVVKDESGSDFALQYQDRQIFVFPKDMIVKRVERNEDFDLEHMLEELAQVVRSQVGDHHIL